MTNAMMMRGRPAVDRVNSMHYYNCKNKNKQLHFSAALLLHDNASVVTTIKAVNEPTNAPTWQEMPHQR
jgi:hypothetical protein